ncbi:tripartite tricarboxylate transporter substrate binding protein [Pigmentiphaga sp.]|uniref:Bug family tripartite tricarboxylate transporter substrate binding protein n=1 Tax=Pigmentiphaga sp. TaxID=1977564 RepID=UPI00128DC988|nr:tripartite tricarboxylate transporter substrate binding protein [Pigmentiphaga sp.]MPS28127.1 tripartite tricarboxylate transporter substrate binding protein [Alcaligenaceae bacterium SAGV5]MPS50753.1 tripartite tricarboxylate transporter substrate binding protein [Alcaligenaceae bacterium SAGV3]MPT57091.1 tripartite tricarboxylate transporter substrate binding protein [Alcaligenaceae bacterium]
MKRRLQGMLAVALVAAVGPAWPADGYPSRPIRIVIPFAPGGTVDILGRVLGEQLGTRLGQPVIIDNRPGAGGNIAAANVARADPDGYTLFLGSMGTQSMNGAIYAKLSFDPVADFAPITRLVTSANLLVVHSSIKANSVKELIDYLKARPGQVNYASAGIGSFNHISAVLFETMAGVKMTHVPYKSGGQALNSVLAGETQLVFQTIPAAVPFIQAGKLRALAVCSEERHPLFPDLPTASESGLPGFEINTWYGMLAPAATPRAVIDKLHGALVQTLQDPAIRKRLTELGLDAAPDTPEQFAALIKTDAVKWGKVIKTAGVVAE